ncbi:MAG: NfeD family protein [Clostridia bacterium]|nr:NfeD family protein [Clostridia bacterium]
MFAVFARFCYDIYVDNTSAVYSRERQDTMYISFLFIVWIGLTILFAVVEAATVSLVSIWFVGGSVAALIASAFTSSLGIQIGVFIIVSALLLLLTRPLIIKKLSPKTVHTNVGINIGRRATVIEAITPEKAGRVKLDGVDWRASCDTALDVGEGCIVHAVNGTTLDVTPEKQTEKA